MNNIHYYTVQDFRDGMPEWKRQKDPVLVKLIFRPISFYVSSFCANRGISANEVSTFSIFVGLAGCACFFFPAYEFELVGLFLLMFWLLLDCTDGNLARTVGHQPFGDFIDALSSYTLVAFLGVSLGYNVYVHGGLLVEAGQPFCIVIGSIASSCDTLMRLSYQKYKNNRNELEDKNVIPKEKDVVSDHGSVNSLLVKINMEMGIASFLLFAVFAGIIFNALDLVVFYMLCYYGGAAIVMITKYIVKAMKYQHIKID